MLDMSLVLPTNAGNGWNYAPPPNFEAVKLCMVQGSTVANREGHVSVCCCRYPTRNALKCTRYPYPVSHTVGRRAVSLLIFSSRTRGDENLPSKQQQVV